MACENVPAPRVIPEPCSASQDMTFTGEGSSGGELESALCLQRELTAAAVVRGSCSSSAELFSFCTLGLIVLTGPCRLQRQTQTGLLGATAPITLRVPGKALWVLFWPRSANHHLSTDTEQNVEQLCWTDGTVGGHQMAAEPPPDSSQEHSPTPYPAHLQLIPSLKPAHAAALVRYLMRKRHCPKT
ncbi:hypothetical protein AAFF_G00211910 [Aldrovandia affinis]|uniref:Uncharacterized protein n=1 Tax=Aldrovandia affinis TaxID=143900 RepID=A0AAD7W5X3_9TELE|nr:hypothetical protein AAFF_G00211910 [Aldrovandia affinis]